jgi:hypothetical protein
MLRDSYCRVALPRGAVTAFVQILSLLHLWQRTVSLSNPISR